MNNYVKVNCCIIFVFFVCIYIFFYLRSNLISALSGLQVNNFAHVDMCTDGSCFKCKREENVTDSGSLSVCSVPSQWDRLRSGRQRELRDVYSSQICGCAVALPNAAAWRSANHGTVWKNYLAYPELCDLPSTYLTRVCVCPSLLETFLLQTLSECFISHFISFFLK